jgi:dTDP-4-dehydrorhamnose reductase
MKVLILGGTGMLGHKLVQVLGYRCEVTATFRKCDGPWRRLPLFTETVQAVGGVDAADFETVRQVVERTRPEVVVNCIGVVKQLHTANDTVTTMQINALLPHRLADLCSAVGARLIHISTDCVFSGSVGGYRESDIPDAEDLYGRSKQLGEVIRPDCLSIRTSIIGREITKAVGLLEWFFGRQGRAVDGFTRAVFSGLTTLEFSRILAQVVSDHGDLAGLYHVASEPITKFDLLSRINHASDLGIDIEAVDEPAINRSLDGSRFVEATGIRVPSWDKMISDLATDPTPYDELRGQYGST